VKFANLRANPHVVLTTGCSRWDRGLDVVFAHAKGDPFGATTHRFQRGGPSR
jgi:hypothetical protein